MTEPLSTRSAALVLISEGERMIAAGRALLGEMDLRVECSALAEAPATSQDSVMMNASDAASALGITPKALHKRMQRGMYLTGHGLRYMGKRITFHRATFLSALGRR